MSSLTTTEVRFPGDGIETQGWICRPEGPGPHPAIVLLHGIGGPGDHYRAAAARFAERGIAGVVFNWMTREKDPPDPPLMRDLEGCGRFLKAQPDIDGERLALSGYCRGGTLAMLALSQITEFSAGVIFHGVPVYRDGTNERRPAHAHDLAESLSAPLLLIHGASDTTAPIDTIYRYASRLNELGKRFELKVYSGTEHAFTLPGGGGRDRYHPQNADDAFQEAVSFLERTWGLGS